METATTPESICNLLARSRLMTPDEVRNLRQRWLREAGTKAADTAQFGKWLVANQYVTDYQAGRVLKGHIDHYFFNDYKLLDRIGLGRMAGVYKGMHKLGQVVAIKVLPPSKGKDAEAFGRFQREARIALRLKHPNVVRTFQTDVAEGLHYIVMEYLDGETLEEVLKRRGKLPPDEAVRLLYQALLGLQHIHQNDVVHRDLTPGNLMLVPAPAPGKPDTTVDATVKILDIGLGLALFDEGAPAGNVNLTTEGSMLGTPDYLAPEQARDAHKADIRADIYSLGCVLFHTLAGQPPFPEKNAVRKMVMHASSAAPRLRTLNPEVNDELQGIVDQMMAKDPSQRFPTPQQAARALQTYLQNRKVSVAPTAAPGHVASYIQWVESQVGDQALPMAVPATASPAYNAADLGVELVAVQASGSALWKRRAILAGVVLFMVLVGWFLARKLN